MTDRVQLGWRVPRESWERFVDHVTEKHADQPLYLRVEAESAMMEFLDENGLLTEAQDLLQEYTDLSELSSSTSAFATDRYQSGNTKLVTHRVRADLKERFKKFADQHDASSYGRLMAAALDMYADGGAARRLLNDVERLVSSATIAGSTDDSVESLASIESSSGSTGDSVESRSSTDASSATTSGSTPDPMVISDAVDELIGIQGVAIDNLNTIHRTSLEQAIENATGSADRDTFELYCEPVLDQLNAAPHPYKDVLYLTQDARDELNLWVDLDKAERIVLLRRWVVAEAIKHSERRRAVSYRDVIELFEDEAGGEGPSHQYAYDLMEAASDEPGFEYGEFSVGTHTSKKQLRVDVSEVSEAILDWARDERQLDPDRIGVIADVTSYSAGSSPQQEAAADD